MMVLLLHLTAAQQTSAELKKQAALKKAGTVFDLEQIQLIAALKGKLSAEERLRVEAQLALLNQNDLLAQQLTKQILMAQDATGGLYKYFLAIGDAKIKNPFAFLDQWLIDFQAKLNALKFPTAGANTPTTVTSNNVSVSGVPIGKVWDPSWSAGGNNTPGASFPTTNVPDGITTPTGNFTYGAGNPLSNVYVPPVINVTVQGNVIREEELINKVLAGAQLSSLSGSPSQIGRISGMFG